MVGLIALGSAAALALAPCPTERPSRPAASEERTGLFRTTAWLYLRLYKLGASAGDGDRCGMHPSCSAYTWQAVQRDGPVLGGMLGAARMMSDHRDPALPLCRQGDRLLRLDPPDEGVFWRPAR